MNADSEKTYTVRGMSCGHCEASVREQVEALEGVTSASADHLTGRLVVAGAGFEDSDVRLAVAGAGYALVV